jgi:hypothetical protein
MLNQPTMEKLLTMRLHGMVEALKTQEQDPAINELSFLERLSLLVDQQWSWRENQALERRLKAAKLRGPACVEDIDYRAARGLDKTVVRALAKRLRLGPQSREYLRDRTVRRGQELYRFGPGPESLSRRPFRTISAGGRVAAGSGSGPSRRQLTPTPGTAEPHRCSGHR